MEAWARKGMERWPDVPALYGWLSLDRRGRWRIRGELISRPQILDTIGRNYECDAQGRWYFQNGPQRGYVALETAPWVLAPADERLLTHTGMEVAQPTAAWLDEEGSLLLGTEHGPGALADSGLDWALSRLQTATGAVDEAALAAALAMPADALTGLWLCFGGHRLPLRRIDSTTVPERLGFVREPRPLPGEKGSAPADGEAQDG